MQVPSIYESIVLGVISGVLTAATLFALSQAFSRIILPWYQGLIYKGALISGSWSEELDYQNGVVDRSTVNLSQKAHNITGTLSVTKSMEGEAIQTDIFNLSGLIQDRIFHAVATPQDTGRVGRIVILLELKGQGHALAGQTTWYDSGASVIASTETTWHKLGT